MPTATTMNLGHDADLLELVSSVRKALRGTSSAYRGAALVDRTCVTGSLARGTFAAGCEATGIVLYLNVDLQFAPHESAQALSSLASALVSGSDLHDESVEISNLSLQIVDTDCQGGLWAYISAAPRIPRIGSDAALGGIPNPDRGVLNGQKATGAQRQVRQLHTKPGQPLVLQLFVMENWTSIVSGLGAEAASTAAGNEEPVDVVEAVQQQQQQQQRLLELAQQRLQREARHQERYVPVPAAAWVAKMSCGVAETRWAFWAQQPEAVKLAARTAHCIWRSVLEEEEQQAAIGVDPSNDTQIYEGPRGRDVVSAPWRDEVMYLIDVLVLHAYKQATDLQMSVLASKLWDDVLHKAFMVLAKEYSECTDNDRVVRVMLPGGVLCMEGSTGGASAAQASLGGAGGVAAVARERGLVVQDPCFPVLDLYAVACEAVGGGNGPDAGQRRLQRLATSALRSAGSVDAPMA